MVHMFEGMMNRIVFNYFELKTITDLVKISKAHSNFNARDVIPIFASEIDSSTREYLYFVIPCEVGAVGDIYFLNIYYTISNAQPKKYIHYSTDNTETIEFSYNTKKAAGFYIPIIHFKPNSPIVKVVKKMLEIHKVENITDKIMDKIQFFRVRNLRELFRIVSLEGGVKIPVYRFSKSNSIVFFAVVKADTFHGSIVRIISCNLSIDEINLNDWMNDIILSGWIGNIVDVVSVKPMDNFFTILLKE